MKPRWMRMQVSCPDCGKIVDDAWDGFTLNKEFQPVGWTCPRCGIHYDYLDFWNEQHEKWSREHKPQDAT